MSERTYQRPTAANGLPLTEPSSGPHSDAATISEECIRAVVDEFYRRARDDNQLGPVFDAHVASWDVHLARMYDFWSAALLRTGRYSGRPVERHRPLMELTAGHFERWVELFGETVRDICTPAEAEAFMWRARLMRQGMTRALGLAEEREIL